jgi:membrane protein insertase Oxa1/YidC/SpoIIIJ
MMLIFFYNMASALVLYWTTSQVLSIGQLLLQRRKSAREQADEGAKAAAPAPKPEKRPAPSQQERNRRRRKQKSGK